jgi:hypothetical protein
VVGNAASASGEAGTPVRTSHPESASAAPLSTAVPALPARKDPLCKSAVGIIV